MRTVTVLSVLPYIMFSACTPAQMASPDAVNEGPSITLTGEAASRVLAAANSFDIVTLDKDVGLDVRAAINIVDTRVGMDGVDGSADDVRFATIEQLDAVTWVGASALGKLERYTRSEVVLEEVQPSIVHGYFENGWQASGILGAANTASYATLDHEIGLDVRAAAAIIDLRGDGFATLAQLDALPYVAQTAFDRLLTYASEMELPEEAGCPRGVIRDDEGTLYDSVGAALSFAPINAYVSVCPGTYGAGGLAQRREGADLSLMGVGRVDLYGDYSFVDGDYRVDGFVFRGAGGGLSLHQSTGQYTELDFIERSRLVAVDSAADLWSLDFDDAMEMKLEDGVYDVYGARFQNMRHDQAGSSPLQVSGSEVVIEASEINGSDGVALRVADGSVVDLNAVTFGTRTDANVDGDVRVAGSTYDGLGFVYEHRCSSTGGCSPR